jgi:hypothetical protein
VYWALFLTLFLACHLCLLPEEKNIILYLIVFLKKYGWGLGVLKAAKEKKKKRVKLGR